ncbi:MAG: hypothetical protein RL641_252 [Candidatus Parcubacteria bacterium]|jgi:hypothetical protein
MGSFRDKIRIYAENCDHYLTNWVIAITFQAQSTIMISNADILRAFFEVNVREGNFTEGEYDMYVASVINYGIAAIAQAHHGRLVLDDLFKPNFISTTEEKIICDN